MPLCEDIQICFAFLFNSCCCQDVIKSENNFIISTTKSPINPDHFEPYQIYKSKQTF